MKFFAKSQNLASEYYAHLIELNRKFAGQPSPYVVLPLDLGEVEAYWYEILPYYENVVSLDQTMTQRGLMRLGEAMSLVSCIGRALSDVHRTSLIHADLKPSNILVAEIPSLTVYLIDFGMAQPMEAEQTVLLVATYRYLHPRLSQLTSAATSRDKVRIELASEIIGPYIDIYAMGVMALEMLTGKADLVHPITEHKVTTLIKERNPSVGEIDSSILHRISNLVFQMLSVEPNRENVSAQSVADLAESIAGAIPTEPRPRVTISPELTGSDDQTSSSVATATLVRELRGIATKLTETTAALAGAGDMEVVSPEGDKETLHEVDTLFGNARTRTQASWRLGIAMTVISFAVIVAMAVTAVTLTVTTGKQAWGLIFGGLSVTSLVGTLIWRPYDRLFRATILAQQIETIHVTIVVGLRGTGNLGERLRICKEAITRLQTVFHEHAYESGTRRSTTRSNRKRKHP